MLALRGGRLDGAGRTGGGVAAALLLLVLLLLVLLLLLQPPNRGVVGRGVCEQVTDARRRAAASRRHIENERAGAAACVCARQARN